MLKIYAGAEGGRNVVVVAQGGRPGNLGVYYFD